MIELVLGGARSGKSRYAEQQASDSGLNVIYIATAEARDDEMQQRIIHHRQSRPASWQTVEEPIKLADTIKQHNNTNNCLLVDCLTLWLCNILLDKQGKIQLAILESETQALLDSLNTFTGKIIFVSNETGLGVVPMDKISRQFVDQAGLLHQKIAATSDKVVLITAGLPQILKQ